VFFFAGDNSDKLCKLCIGKIPGDWCSSADPYFGFEGAFRCLVEAGEIAFLKHTTVDEMTSKSYDFSETFYTLCLFYYLFHISQYNTFERGDF
jgi:hypothetical protein